MLPDLCRGWLVSPLTGALAAARHGWPVFPLRPGQKRPRVADWETVATTSRDRISWWWRRHPDDNVAIATGRAGLVVVDLDVARPDEPRPAGHPHARGGHDVLDALGCYTPGSTWTVETASGGRHLYFRAPAAGGPWRNTAGRIGWHIDTRAAGGYVVSLGSIVAGRIYIPVDGHQVVELPPWLAARLAPPAPLARTVGADLAPKGRGYAPAALAGEIQRVLDAPVGQRNAALNRAAWNLARHIATGVLVRGDVEAALQVAGEAAGGQSPAGVAATIRSAIDARLRHSLKGHDPR
jgi:Bifunctional DNA primase/polymerase, N-terminal